MTGMQTRLKMILNNNPAFLAALYLDPRYNFDSEHEEGSLPASNKEKAIVSFIVKTHKVHQIQQQQSEIVSNTC